MKYLLEKNRLKFARPLALAVVVAALAAVSGCGSSKPKPADLGPNVPVLKVRQTWSAKIGALADMQMQAHVQGTTVTVASAGGEVLALDARTGGDVWRTRLNVPLASGVGSDGRWTAVTSKDNQLIVLDEGGRELWRQSLSAQTYTAPLVAGNRVFVLASDRSVSAFDAATGYRLWNQQRPGEPLILRQAGVLLAVGDTLVAGLSGRLVGFNPNNGAVRWEAPLASPRGTNDVERLVEIVGPVSRVGDSICARAFQATVGCINAVRGGLSWTQTASGNEGVSGDDVALFGTESNGTVIAWSRADGNRLWTTERLLHRGLTAPLLLGRSVVVGDDTGLVHLLSRDDAAPLNRLTTDGSGITAAPVAVGETLVVVTRNGGIYGFRPD